VTTDKKIQELADLIREVVGHRCEVIAIGPERYNQMHRKFRTVNKMLAWGHGKVIENLHLKVPSCPRALSDQFAAPELIESELKAKKIEIHLEQRTKAESDIAVAAASILAREKYVLALKELGNRLGVVLPKGSGTPASEMGERLFKERGEEVLRTVAKAHFRTFEIVCGRPAPEKKPWVKRS
jgi:ribonuclease HIII